MDTQKVISAIKDQYGLLKSVPFMDFAFKGMLWCTSTFWVFIFNHVVCVLESLYGYLTRLKEEKGSGYKSVDDGKRDDQFGEELFQMLEGFLFGEVHSFSSDSGDEGRSEEDESLSISTNRYRFCMGDSLSGFIKEPQVASFTVQELFLDSAHRSFKNLETATRDVSAEEEGFQESDSDIKAEARGRVLFDSLAEHNKHEQANGTPSHLGYGESAEEVEELSTYEYDRLVSPPHRNEGSIESDDDEKQGKAVSVCGNACERADMMICSENRLVISPDDHEREVPDCCSRCEDNSGLAKPELGSYNLSKREDMIVLDLGMQGVFGTETESIGSTEAVINGDEKIDISFLDSHREDIISLDEYDTSLGETGLSNNDIQAESCCPSKSRLAPPDPDPDPDPEQESVGSNEPISRSSSDEKLVTREEQSTFVLDALSEREGGLIGLGFTFTFLGKHDFSYSMQDPTSPADLDDSETKTEVLSDHNGSEEEVSEPKTPHIMDDKRLDYDAEEDSPPPVPVEFMELEANLKKSSAVTREEKVVLQSRDHDEEDSACKGSEPMKSSVDRDEVEVEEIDSAADHRDSDDEMEEEDDVLWEHQERMKQMRKEMRSYRTIGLLPTILEESEYSPRLDLDEDFKPLRIHPKSDHKDRMDEIQLFYKSYSGKMRKLDILSHQTLNAIRLAQLKTQDELSSKRKLASQAAAIKSLLPYKLRRHVDGGNPLKMLMRDLERDSEVVYVGQLCLSWEILKWQYQKALDLQDYDSWGSRPYSIAAGEFQQFHVLVQRFTEDEPFQGPRVQYYLRSRRAQCNLLQVPLVRSDDLKNGRKGDVEDGITITTLVEIAEESMRAYWEFLHADKGEAANATLKGMIGSSNPDLEDPSDMELLTDIRANLQKKERRVKDLVRSGNCIVKKFQKCKNQRLNHDMMVAQVELRLVSRVISMSRLTTDQILWCHKKVGKVNFVGRKIHVDSSSLLLFPC
ncbi:hypothetical protein Dimus_014917 [Dionaea muscipula]